MPLFYTVEFLATFFRPGAIFLIIIKILVLYSVFGNSTIWRHCVLFLLLFLVVSVDLSCLLECLVYFNCVLDTVLEKLFVEII